MSVQENCSLPITTRALFALLHMLPFCLLSATFWKGIPTVQLPSSP